MSISPSASPLQLTFEILSVNLNSSGWFTTKVLVITHPLASVIFTVYEPALRPVWSIESDSKPLPSLVVHKYV